MAVWPYLAAGAALVGGAVAWRLYKGATAAPAAASEDACDKLAALGAPASAVAACKAAKALAGALPSLPDAQKGNRELNGMPTYTTPAAFVAAVARLEASSGMATSYRGPFGFRFVVDLEYPNGFVPIAGHPSFAKGAPGSKDITDDAFFRTTSSDGYARSGLLSGDPARDLLTYKWTPERAARARDVLKRDVTFPLAVPAGAEAWVVRGRPIVCAAGTTVNNGRDHRTHPGPVCAPPAAPVPPPTGGSRSVLGVTVSVTQNTGGRNPDGGDYRSDPPR